MDTKFAIVAIALLILFIGANFLRQHRENRVFQNILGEEE